MVVHRRYGIGYNTGTMVRIRRLVPVTATDLAGITEGLESNPGGWMKAEIRADGSQAETVLVRLALSKSGTVVCTGLLLGLDAPTEISARQLRRIPLATLTGLFADNPEFRANWIELGLLAGDSRPRVQPGPKGHSRQHYEQVAKAYRKAAKEAPEAPVKRLSELLLTPENKPMPEPTLRRWLRECRRLGLLKPGKVGRPAMKRTTLKEERS